MVRRSNAFQKLIYYIHEQTEGTETWVTESAKLNMANVEEAIPREVDVLIERKVHNQLRRIAIECRDRAAKDDITWIDGMIGKYKNLPVNRVIAVSNSGFSANAIKIADAEGIELRSLKDALATDWSKEFIKPRLTITSRTFKVRDVKFNFNTEENIVLKAEDQMRVSSGEVGTVSEFINCLLSAKSIRQQFFDYYSDHFPEIFETRSDFNRVLIAEQTIPIPGCFLIRENGINFEIASVQLKIVGLPTNDDATLTHHNYQNARVSQGDVKVNGIGGNYRFFLAQFEGKSEMKIFFEKRKGHSPFVGSNIIKGNKGLR